VIILVIVLHESIIGYSESTVTVDPRAVLILDAIHGLSGGGHPEGWKLLRLGKTRSCSWVMGMAGVHELMFTDDMLSTMPGNASSHAVTTELVIFSTQTVVLTN